ncbi:MAG: EamA family transporter [Prevotellaceae bacterium]|jgi:undecaprenyl phosphate-alpha-L-ara4N flippase subunit ArnE|nr:EamA family transporter [Prevotellaceae bacterium]
MLKIITLAIVQSFFLAGGQVCVKLAMEKMPSFNFSWHYFFALLTNWWFLATGVFFGVATVLWLYMIKHFEFSVVYPITSIAYVFGMLAAIYIFGETVPIVRWLGVLLIMAGTILIAK